VSKIALLNDTYSWYHWGCTATSAALRKRIAELGFEVKPISIRDVYGFGSIPKQAGDFENPVFFQKACQENQELISQLAECEIIVINGEGTLHHLTQPTMALLYLAYACKRFLGKRVQIINHSAYPANCREPKADVAFQLYKSVYETLDYVAIREHFSHELMTATGVEAELSFDCLPLTVLEDYQRPQPSGEKTLVVSGSVAFAEHLMSEFCSFTKEYSDKGFQVKMLVGAQANPAADDVRFVENLRMNDQFTGEIIEAISLKEWFDCIALADVFVSGRFHHTIAASFLKVPCVLIESNTLKIEALTESLKFQPPVQYRDANFGAELKMRTDCQLDDPKVADEEVLSLLRQRAETNFDGLRRVA